MYAKIYNKDGAEVDLTKNSLPSGGKYEKVTLEIWTCLDLSVFSVANHPRLPVLVVQAGFRSSAFKPVAPKNFSSMQNLYPSPTSDDGDHGLSNGLHRAYAHAAKAVSTSSSSPSPSRQGGGPSTGNKVA